MNKLRILLIPVLTLMLLSNTARAWDGRTYLGGWFSTKGVGVTAVFAKDSYFHEVRLAADLAGLIRGRADFPGIRAEWNMNYYFAGWTPYDGFRIRLYAGPGAMLGYVDDGDSGRGVTAALSGTIGGAFWFFGPVCITVGFTGALGCHAAFTDSHDTTLTLYTTGLKNILTPEIGIRYGF